MSYYYDKSQQRSLMARRRQSRSAVFRHPDVTPIFSDKDRAAKAASLLDRVDDVSILFVVDNLVQKVKY